MSWSAIFNPDSGRPQVFSHGGGTQGSAICALIVTGNLPKPDAAIIADTGREASQTWAFWTEHTRPALEEIGIPCHQVPHSFTGEGYNTVDLLSGRGGETIVMPMFTPAFDGSRKESQLPKFCSNEWKRRPIERFLRRELGYFRADIWIGYSLDEATTRAKMRPNNKFRDVYPLIELGLSRSDCEALAKDVFKSKPPRSACWMCPYRSKSEWLDLRDNWPEDFAAAIRLERQLRLKDPEVYFHRSCVTLDLVDWDKAKNETYKPGCQSGLCFT